jgi:AraC family transcriptional regulator
LLLTAYFRSHPAIAYINTNLGEELSLKQLAAVANMSQFYFARQFKQAKGIPPNQYVSNRRMEQAKQLLARRELKVTEVAEQVGIQSQSHFNKVFREYTGVTPKAY